MNKVTAASAISKTEFSESVEEKRGMTDEKETKSSRNQQLNTMKEKRTNFGKNNVLDVVFMYRGKEKNK